MDRRSFLRLLAALPATGFASEGPPSPSDGVADAMCTSSDGMRLTASGFVHLRVHTEYSFLESTIRIRPLVARVKALGMQAVAITDRGNLCGAVELQIHASKAGVKPIFGCTVAVGSRCAPGEDELTLLAMNADGYSNLCRLITAGHAAEEDCRRARVDRELLRELNGGLIALCGAGSSEIDGAVAMGDSARVRCCVEAYAGIFGERCYMDLRGTGSGDSVDPAQMLADVAHELGVGVVATHDCRYLEPAGAAPWRILEAIRSGTALGADAGRDGGSRHVRSVDEMRAAFLDHPETLSSAASIAARCDFELPLHRARRPAFPGKAGEPPEPAADRLRRLARSGLEDRLARRSDREAPHGAQGETYLDRLERELASIVETGFADYFLVVADYVGEAKRRGIEVGPGRGSTAGSLVAYALGITTVDPLQHGLLFERALNPARSCVVDIDVDFCAERRDEVVRYVQERYGSDRVAEIPAFGRRSGRAALRNVGRILGLDDDELGQIDESYPEDDFRRRTIAEALAVEPRLTAARDRTETCRRVFGAASELEGLIASVHPHASGIIISSHPLVEDVPLFRAQGAGCFSQLDWEDTDQIGLEKFDFLTLGALTVLRRTCERVRETCGRELDLEGLPLDDAETYALLATGETNGLFQLEGGIRDLVVEAKPAYFEHLAALLALYRPGPLDHPIAEGGATMRDLFLRRRHGRETVPYLHPALKPILRETYGLIVYQEQLTRMVESLGGYSLQDAEEARRALVRRTPVEVALQRKRFIEAATGPDLPDALAAAIFHQMERFAVFGFCKAHAVCYALIAYRMAHLKAHFREEFDWAVASVSDTEPEWPA